MVGSALDPVVELEVFGAENRATAQTIPPESGLDHVFPPNYFPPRMILKSRQLVVPGVVVKTDAAGCCRA